MFKIKNKFKTNKKKLHSFKVNLDVEVTCVKSELI